MGKIKNEYFDIIDRVPADKQARAYELHNLIEFTEWNITSEMNDLIQYKKEYKEILGEAYEG